MVDLHGSDGGAPPRSVHLLDCLEITDARVVAGGSWATAGSRIVCE